jgi:antitoxin component YwqK of YwqJK toxin-antitoxin module
VLNENYRYQEHPMFYRQYLKISDQGKVAYYSEDPDESWGNLIGYVACIYWRDHITSARHADGKLTEEWPVYYSDSRYKPHGIVKYYKTYGPLRMTQEWHNGVQDGIVHVYDTDTGEETLCVVYDNGEKVGECQ